MRRTERLNLFSKFCTFLSRLSKTLFNFASMRRVLTRVLNRVLLSDPFSGRFGSEVEIHTKTGKKLVVGLGNPGMEGSRHSVGMAVLAALAARLGVADGWRSDRHVSGDVIESEVGQSGVVLLRPRLLMNANGVSVAKAAGKYGIRPQDILLVHDELDKPLGKVAVKLGGSARGHNGVRSCVDCLRTDVMTRLRVGIGRPANKSSVERHVLSRFSAEERPLLDSVLPRCVDLLLSQLSQGDSAPAGGGKATPQREAAGSAAAHK